jgi:hypothetical protein
MLLPAAALLPLLLLRRLAVLLLSLPPLRPRSGRG